MRSSGRALVLELHPASIQDRDGAGPLLKVSRQFFPLITRVFPDGDYAEGGDAILNATVPNRIAEGEIANDVMSVFEGKPASE